MTEEVKNTREWTSVRDECVSGGNLTGDCNLVQASHGGQLVVTMSRLICGCLIFPADTEEIIL